MCTSIDGDLPQELLAILTQAPTPSETTAGACQPAYDFGRGSRNESLLHGVVDRLGLRRRPQQASLRVPTRLEPQWLEALKHGRMANFGEVWCICVEPFLKGLALDFWHSFKYVGLGQVPKNTCPLRESASRADSTKQQVAIQRPVDTGAIGWAR